MTKLVGINVTTSIVPGTTEDIFPTHMAKYGQGGWQEVADTTARDAITSVRREAGMAVYVTGESKLYTLNSDLTTWTLFETGKIDVIKVNGTEQPIVDKAVDIAVPLVEDSVTSTSKTDALSANQGKLLQDQVDALKAIGRYLSNWNCFTGLPTTNPKVSPYIYNTGDYFYVSFIDKTSDYPAYDAATVYNKNAKCKHENLYYICKEDGVTGEWDSTKWDLHAIKNCRPNGDRYVTGVASTTEELEEVAVGDIYLYDSTNWILLRNTQKTVTFAAIAGSPYDNSALSTALNSKQATLTAGTNITIDPTTNEISATDTTYSAGTGLSLSDTTFSADTSVLQEKLTAGNNITIDSAKVIAAKDTTYTAGNNIIITPAKYVAEGYRAVAYIESNGTGYIDTGKKYLTTSVITMLAKGSFEYEAGQFGHLAGMSGDGDYTNSVWFYVTNNKESGLSVGGNGYSHNSDKELETLVINIPEGKKYFNGVEVGEQFSITPEDLNVYLFASNKTGTAQYLAKGKIFSYTQDDGDTKTIDLIACVRESDSTAGFYDKVSKTFITCAGLTAGPFINVDQYIISGKDGKIYEGGTGITINDTVISVDTGVIQPKLVAGTNINIDQTTNTISATSIESFFRGKWDTWTLVPNVDTGYPSDYKGNKTPTEGDYMVVGDATDYSSDFGDITTDSEEGRLDLSTGLIIPDSLWITTRYLPAIQGKLTVFNLIRSYPLEADFAQVCFYDSDKQFLSSRSGTATTGAGEYTDMFIIPENTAYIRMNYLKTFDTNMVLRYQGSTGLVGSWRFAYHGTWATDNKDGWKPEYQLEDTLPIATDIQAGIAKLYTTTGTHTDGSMDQNSITNALGNKQNKLTAGNNIKIDNTTATISAVDSTYLAGHNISITVPFAAEGYTPIKYVESDGVHYIDTLIKLTATSEITFIGKGIESYTPADYRTLAGIHDENSEHTYTIIALTSNYIGAQIGSITNTTLSTNEFETIKIDVATNKMYLNGVEYEGDEITPDVTSNVYLFASNNTLTAYKAGKVRLREFSIKNGTTLVLDLFPCIRNSDNVVGLYDTVSNTFFTCDGLTPGKEVHEYIINTTGGDYTAGAGLKLNSFEFSANTDNATINTNTDSELQSIGFINNRDSTTAMKSWTGTKLQYDAITTKDNNTIYNITDEYGIILQTVPFSGITGNPYDNANLTIALTAKQGKLLEGNNIHIDPVTNTISVTGITGYSAGNGLTLTGTTFSANVEDNVTSTSTTDALSANQGKLLQAQIDTLKSLGRYLSNWNCATGLPTTTPGTSPYTYHTGDYYYVTTIDNSSLYPTYDPALTYNTGDRCSHGNAYYICKEDGVTGEWDDTKWDVHTLKNYKPDGPTYTTGVRSTVEETGTVNPGDIYLYDSSSWALLTSASVTPTFANLAGQPTDNAALATALNAKANDDNVLHKAAGAETVTSNNVNGYKTFNNSIKIGNPSNQAYSTFTTDSNGVLKILANAKTSGLTFNSQVVEPNYSDTLSLGSASKAWVNLYLNNKIVNKNREFTFPSKAGTFALTDDIVNIQVTTMPTPSASYNDKIIQYIGETTADYTKGYFYKGNFVDTPASAVVTATAGTEHYENITVNLARMLALFPTGMENDIKYEMGEEMFAGQLCWRAYDSTPPYEMDTNLIDNIYGISYDGRGSVEEEGDVLHYVVTPASTTGTWVQVNVQPSSSGGVTDVKVDNVSVVTSGVASIDLSGKQDAITTTNKISADLIDTTSSTNKFVTADEKTAWNGKQNELTAGAGIEIENDIISANVSNALLPTSNSSIKKLSTFDGYDRVSWIKSDGVNPFNLGVLTYTNLTTINMTWSMDTYNYSGSFFGCTNITTGCGMYISSNTIKLIGNYGQEIAAINGMESMLRSGTIHTMTYEPNGNLTVDTDYKVNPTTSEFSGDFGSLDVYLFSVNRVGETPVVDGNIKIYGFSATRFGTPFINLYPVVRKSDSVLGFLDSVTSTFYPAPANYTHGDFILDELVFKVPDYYMKEKGAQYGSNNLIGGSTTMSIANRTNYSTLLGRDMSTTNGTNHVIAIGYGAKANANYAIQLGTGTNAEASSFCVALSDTNNYKLLGSTGIIPADRMADTTSATAGMVLKKTTSGTEWASESGGPSYTEGTGIKIENNVISATGVTNSNDSTELKFWKGTQAEYEAITSKDSSTVYVIVG